MLRPSPFLLPQGKARNVTRRVVIPSPEFEVFFNRLVLDLHLIGRQDQQCFDNAPLTPCIPAPCIMQSTPFGSLGFPMEDETTNSSFSLQPLHSSAAGEPG